MEVHKVQGNRQSGPQWNGQQPQRPGSNAKPHMTRFNDQKQVKVQKRKLFQLWSETAHPESATFGV